MPESFTISQQLLYAYNTLLDNIYTPLFSSAANRFLRISSLLSTEEK